MTTDPLRVTIADRLSWDHRHVRRVERLECALLFAAAIPDVPLLIRLDRAVRQHEAP